MSNPLRVFVDGIGHSTREGDLAELFGQFGRVRQIVIVGDSAGGRKDYGFVTFACDDGVAKVMAAGQLTCKGRILTVGRGRGEGETTRGRGRQQVTKQGQVRLVTGLKQSPATVKQRMRISTSDSAADSQSSEVGHAGHYRDSRISSKSSKTNHNSEKYKSTECIQNRPSPVHYRHFSSPVPYFPSSPMSPNLQNTSAYYINLSPQAQVTSFSCSPYQPLPLVFPIYYADTFHMSTTPLPPGYFIRPVS